MPERFAVIIGSYFDGFGKTRDGAAVSTRYGAPSAPIRTGQVGAQSILTIARHGDDHTIPPHAINYRANLVALLDAGATSVIAINSVGVVSGIRGAGQIAVPDQILDYTSGRENTIYDGTDGAVAHVDFTEPFSSCVRRQLLAAAVVAGIDCYDGGVYAATDGPRLETAAEIDRFEIDGADYIGMTAMPEAALARELGLKYACLALIVNRAAGRGDRPIYDDVESSTQATRTQAKSVLNAFFRSH